MNLARTVSILIISTGIGAKQALSQDVLGGSNKEHTKYLRANDQEFVSSNDDNSCTKLADVEWHLKYARVMDAWKYSEAHGKASKGEGIVVAVPDTGYAKHVFTSTQNGFTTEMYKSKGHNWFGGIIRQENENDAFDPFGSLGVSMNPGHGTLVSAVIAGPGTHADENEDKVSGVAPKAKILPLRIVESVVFFDLSKLRLAIDYAKNNGAHVVSMSLGNPTPGALSFQFKWAWDDAINNNLILIAAAGQAGEIPIGGPTNIIMPASYINSIAVAAVDKDGNYWNAGFTGKNIAFSAPGHDMCVPEPTQGVSKTAQGSGTSLATAMTSGTAALWLAHHGRQELISIAEGRNEKLQHLFCKAVEASAKKMPNWNEATQGAGILDVQALLELNSSKLRDLPQGATKQCKIDIGRKVGESCNPLNWCAPGLSCASPMMKCYHSPRQVNEPCNPVSGCAPGLSCASPMMKCYHSPRQVNEPCNPVSGCASGLRCSFSFSSGFSCKKSSEYVFGKDKFTVTKKTE